MNFTFLRKINWVDFNKSKTKISRKHSTVVSKNQVGLTMTKSATFSLITFLSFVRVRVK